MRATAAMVVRGIALIALVLCTPKAAVAQFNENCTVSVLNRNVRVNADGSWVLPNIPANFGPVRARVTCVVNGETISGESEPFIVPANGVVNLPHIVFGQTTPIPTALTVTANPKTLTQIGATAQITVTAHYGDGSAKDVTTAASGTQYTTSNSAIATISAAGVATAVQSGTVLVQATLEGASGLTSVPVVLEGASHGGVPDAWALANGLDPNDPTMPSQDSDRDGLTNLQEFQGGTNPRNRDTDGDGLTDGDETNGSHTNPLLADSDGDKIPDGLELQTGTDPLKAASYDLKAVTASSLLQPPSFRLTTSPAFPEASQQLTWKVTLIDGKTTLDLTLDPRTTYASNNLTVCSFGGQKGLVFAGSAGSCVITISQNTLSVTVAGTVQSFTPTALGFVTIPGFANNVDVSGTFAYVAAGSAGLQVVDVTNPAAPQIVAARSLPGNANDVVVFGTHAYVAAGGAGLQVIDIANPHTSAVVGALAIGGVAWDVMVKGNRAYIANGANGLLIVDVSSASAPVLLGALSLPGTTKGVDVDAVRQIAVVARGTDGVSVVNVANPAAPSLMATVAGGDVHDVAVSGNYAFLADYSRSFTAVDLTNPAAPVLRASTPPSTGGLLQDVAINGTIAAGADVFFVNGVPLVDVTIPASPQPRAILNFSGFRDDNGTGIAMDARFVYLTAEAGSVSENGTTGNTRLYIGQYRDVQDNNGVPPTVQISSPQSGTAVVYGSIVTVTVDASDDVAIAGVNFLVDGQVAFTAASVPYKFTFTAPTTGTGLTLGATAVDFGNNVGVAPAVVVNLIPDPLTTASGRVVTAGGATVAGATVTCGGQTGQSQSDGGFSISGIPTLQPSFTCTVRFVDSTGVILGGTAASVPVVRGGISAAGDIAIAPIALVLSITPSAIDAVHPPSSISITGVNLTGSSFRFVPTATPSPVTVGVPAINVSGTAAVLPIVVDPSARGRFVLVGTNSAGDGDTTAMPGNTLTLINAQDDGDTDGDGFQDGLELLFGSDPANKASVPDLTKRGDVRSAFVSIVNAFLPPAQHEALSPAFSVANTVVTQTTAQVVVSAAFSVANTAVTSLSPQTALSPSFSVANGAVPPTTQIVTGAAVSVLNANPTTTQKTTAGEPGQAANAIDSASTATIRLERPRENDRLIEGQTISVQALVSAGQSISSVEFSVDGQLIAVSSAEPYVATFTVPSGVTSLVFGAVASSGTGGARVAAAPVRVNIAPDTQTTITGRVVDVNGRPIEGAIVDLLSEGLQAEFFDFASALTAIPDLQGRTPDHVTRVTAINTRNPNGVFGPDPFGLGLGTDYAARYTGWVTVSNAGSHRFFLGTHEGARLKVAGVTVVDLSSGTGAFQEGSGTAQLSAGLVPIELTYYEGSGSPELQLSWTPPGAERQVVLPSSLVPGLQPFVATTDASGTFMLRNVPAALANVRVRASTTVENQTISVVADRIEPVPATTVTVGDIVIGVPRR